jgi:hypothetical protein
MEARRSRKNLIDSPSGDQMCTLGCINPSADLLMLPSAGVCEVAVILKLLRDWLGVLVVAIASTACGYHSPTAPPPPPAISTTAPFALSLGAAIGQGAEAGRAVVTAKIQNSQGAPLADVIVTFATDIGTVDPAQAATQSDGTASTTVTADTTATVIVQAGSLTAKMLVVSEPVASPPPSSPPPVPTPPSPPLPTPPPPSTGTPYPYYTAALSASVSSLLAFDFATLTATVTPNNGAPPPTSYAWDCDGNGTPEVTDTATTHLCQYRSAGTVTSKVTVSGGAAAAIASTTITVTALPILTVAILPVSLAPAIGVSDDFTATVTSGPPIPASFKWEWDTNGDGTYDVTIASASNPNTKAITFGTHGAQTVKVRVTDVPTERTAIGTVQVTVP